MSIISNKFGKGFVMAGLLAGSSLLATASFAMPFGGPDKGGCEARKGQQAQHQREDFRAKHMAALKDKLKLSPKQENAWNDFTSASIPAKPAMNKVDRQARQDDFKRMNTPQRMDKMLAMADQRHARMVQRAETVKQFYAQLSPEQRATFDSEARMSRHMGHHRHGGKHRHS
jgi:Spy/CpxP family protein refolding chaperone